MGIRSNCLAKKTHTHMDDAAVHICVALGRTKRRLQQGKLQTNKH